MELAEQRVECPYCGEPITLLLDAQDSGVDYIEDCQVCCQPMIVAVHEDGGGQLFAAVRREDD